jgi:hypothetical protein
MRRLCLTLAGMCFVFASGCQKLDYQGTIKIEAGTTYHETEFKGPKSEQKVQVSVKSGEPVTVYVLLGDDKDEAINAMRDKRTVRKLLASEEKTKEATLEATVPAGKPFVVLLLPADQKKDVEVKIDVKAK